jgi:hypothetical protein
MSVEIRYSVLSPEDGVQKIFGAPPPNMGGPRPGTSGQPPKMPPPTPLSYSLAKRLSTLDNKTLYLVDTGYGGSYRFMQQLQKWFHEHMPSVNIIRKRKTGHVFTDDTTDLWEEIKNKGDAVVLGVAG